MISKQTNALYKKKFTVIRYSNKINIITLQLSIYQHLVNLNNPVTMYILFHV